MADDMTQGRPQPTLSGAELLRIAERLQPVPLEPKSLWCWPNHEAELRELLGEQRLLLVRVLPGDVRKGDLIYSPRADLAPNQSPFLQLQMDPNEMLWPLRGDR